MTLTRKDAGALVLTTGVVLVFAATHEKWGVPLIGDSRRWAAVAILLLGLGACSLGSPGKDRTTKLLAVLGVVALGLAIIALITASLTALSFLTLDVVLLFVLATRRHSHERDAARRHDRFAAHVASRGRPRSDRPGCTGRRARVRGA